MRPEVEATVPARKKNLLFLKKKKQKDFILGRRWQLFGVASNRRLADPASGGLLCGPPAAGR